MRLIFICYLVLLACLGGGPRTAHGQVYPGGGGQVGGGRPGISQPGGGQSSEDLSSAKSTEKPDAAAKKAFTAGVKSLSKAREFEEAAAKAANPDKQAAALDKAGDAYGRALDQFTEALRNKGDMVDAWNGAGYVHLRLGAYNESIDDYNHALKLKPDLLEAVEHRGEAYMGFDRLDEAKAAYMDLFNHARPLADQLMVSMQKWLASHRAAPSRVRAADIDSFDKWLQERDGIAKQTASIPQ
ncbi:MAG TPA: tetratricopeptide repeat protein [Steroidobacteraceae bacterium]|nr:tetratricopeptide repeat protein [Steroidobacteraceae bacterium]